MAAEAFGADLVLACDVGSDESIAQCFFDIKAHYGDDSGLDGLVHAIGFAPADQINGDFTANTTREGFAIAHDISSYSLVALAKAARDMLAVRGGSILTLTYEGSVSVFPNYNVMGLAKASLEAAVRYLAVSLGEQGIRVNAISAGPIKTLAASGIGDFSKMLNASQNAAPLKKNVSQMEVAHAALFLLSDWASGITAEIMFVDAGLNVLGASGVIGE